MLWKGRRQSVNVDDLTTSANIITINWVENSAILSQLKDSYGVGTDGTILSDRVFTAYSQQSLVIMLEKAWGSYLNKSRWIPQITTNQRNTLVKIIGNLKNKDSVAVISSDEYLQDVIINILYNT